MRDNPKFYNILQLGDKIGHEKWLALPFFHVFTGYDNTSSFYRQGKCKFWDKWMKNGGCHNVTETFTVLSYAPELIDETHIVSIKNYLMSVYFASGHKYSNMDEADVSFFKLPNAHIRSTITSRVGLIEHIKRSSLQAGWIWKSWGVSIEIPNPTLWRWLCPSVNPMTFLPEWCETSSHANKCIITWSCRSTKCDNCKCSKQNISCIFIVVARESVLIGNN